MSGILGIIPARGGSKGIPRKNLAPLAGKPLILHTLEAALQSRALTGHVVSTDDEEIAHVCRAAGGHVPFLRPAELASDEAGTLGVVQHAVRWFEEHEGGPLEVVVLLQPTAPLRTAEDIDRAVERFRAEEHADCLISVCDASEHHPRTLYTRGQPAETRLRAWVPGSMGMRRQDFEPVWRRNGALYVAARALVMTRGQLLTETPLFYEMPLSRSVNIDSPLDLQRAAILAASR